MDALGIKLQTAIDRAIARRLFPACVIGVVATSGERLVAAHGKLTFDAKAPAVTQDTIFDMASVTKVVVTTSLALTLIDQGRLHPSDKLIDYVPEFANSDRNNVYIRHLLTQTLNYNFRLSDYKDRGPEGILRALFTTDFKNPPGELYFNTNANSILLGLVITRVFGQPLDVLARHYFFEPLKMGRSGFAPLDFPLNQIAPTDIQPWRGGLVHGVVHDDSAYVLSQKMVVGAAGLFSTAPDLLTFLEVFLHDGTQHGHRYFSPEIIQQIQTNQLEPIGQWSGLGWSLNQPSFMGKHCGPNTFGKTGFTGTSLVCDIDRGVGIVIVSNLHAPHDQHRQYELMPQFRAAIADTVFENT